MKKFICGGSGFVGQALTRRLLAEGHEVRIYDKKLPVLGSGYCGDIKDIELLRDAMWGSEIVYHLASNADISKAVTQPNIDFYEGTLLTQNVLEVMRVSGVRKLVYFSGSGVYGESPGITFREDHGPCLPISTYGASKLACEAMISAYCAMFGIEAKVFRPANIVGTGQTHGVGLDFMTRLKDDPTTLRILGDGTQSKSYVHIDDALDAVALTLTDWSTRYEVFNVASGDAISVLQIAAIATKMLGIDGCNFEHTPGDRGWKGDVPVIQLNCDRLRSLGWRPKMSSAEAVTAALRGML